MNTKTTTEEKKLSLARKAAYTLAAGAATGAAATDVDAAIVYSGVYDIAVASGFSQNINLDLDGYQDINLQNFTFGGPYQGASISYGPGQLVGFNNGLAYVLALAEGDLIDATTVGPGFFGALAYGSYPNSEFDSATDAYIGFSFPSGPNLFYAWMRVSIDNAAGTFIIHDWAFETEQGKGIHAGQVPEPGTLGLLAAGAAGVSALRRRRKDD